MLLTFNLLLSAFHHPSLFHSRLKTFLFSADPSHRSLPFLFQNWLSGFPGLFTDTSEHICFLLFSFSVFHFLVVGSVQQIKLIRVGFWVHVKITSPIVSYREHMRRAAGATTQKSSDIFPNSKLEIKIIVIENQHYSRLASFLSWRLTQ